MTVAVRAAAVSLVALSLLACGTDGGNSEEGAIEEMVEQFFRAFEDGDVELLASLFAEQCSDMTPAATSAIQQYEDLVDVEFELEDVSIQNLTESTAGYLPQGTVKSAGEEALLSGPDEEYTPVVKENGEWKIAECDLFL